MDEKKRGKLTGDVDAKNNAFAVLMSSKKKRRRVSSRFVSCPAGCGAHVLEINIHEHLNKCLAENENSTEKTEIRKEEKQELPSMNGADFVSVSDEKEAAAGSEIEATPLATGSDEHQTAPLCTPEPCSPGSTMSATSPNAFEHMMKKSQSVFSSSRQEFRLDANANLSWTTFEHKEQYRETNKPIWSATVTLKRKSSPARLGEDQLVLNSSIPSAAKNDGDEPVVTYRFVRNHSRLSVPVLKSILQKSIRRRRPLPAVRVAMELMDKSLGDLLRRLPIIILEDSFLHPKFSLVVWLMVAHSKGFIVPSQLLTAVLRIVYEVASCPWTDSLVTAAETGVAGPSSSKEDNDVSSRCSCSPDTLSWCDVLTEAMLLRRQ